MKKPSYFRVELHLVEYTRDEEPKKLGTRRLIPVSGDVHPTQKRAEREFEGITQRFSNILMRRYNLGSD